MGCKGIDVAQWNHEKDENKNLIDSIDWKKVKANGVEFVIVKGINKQGAKEKGFDFNYNGATSVGLPVDVYNYSYATTVNKAISDAKTVLSVIKGKNIGCVWLDVEDKTQMNLGMTLIDIIKAYQEIIEKARYKFGVYTGLSFYNTNIKPYRSFLNCDFWIARYPSNAVMDLSFDPIADKKPVIMHPLWGWQYTSTGRIDGISGNVDLSIRYDNKTGIEKYSLKNHGEEYISKNFKINEFRCKDGSDKILIDIGFVIDKLQTIRNHFNVPVTINSAYRTESYNKKVGGAKSSYHMMGQAFDIVVKGHTPLEVAQYAQKLGINGIIQYNTFVHVDSRTTRYWARNNNGKVTVKQSF